MAGINTAVTGVGTGLGVGATVTGLVKASKDKEIEVKLEELRAIEQRNPNDTATEAAWNTFSTSLDSESENAKKEIAQYYAEIEKLNKQSKSLGNWRTGLLAGNTATNVAGAIISGTNQVKGDLQSQIDNCKASVKNLRDSIMQAKLNKEDVSEAESIVKACGEYDYVDISKINNRAKGAMISSIVGATTGLTGTVTSAVANRNDNTDSGKQKEKNLNTTSNVLASASTVASATATVFNATQISAIKKVASVAEKCTEVLK